jgi:hypothetical protein
MLRKLEHESAGFSSLLLNLHTFMTSTSHNYPPKTLTQNSMKICLEIKLPTHELWGSTFKL